VSQSRWLGTWWLVLFALAAPAGRLGAQEGEGAPPERGERRVEAERRFRERLATVVQQRLGLTDPQMQKLAESNQRFMQQRQSLFKRERDLRMSIRREVTADVADSARLSGLIDQIIAVQRERLDLLAAEQHDLSRFLTPVQRAKYLEMQEQLRRRVERAGERHRLQRPTPGGRR
jgi:Spy/CpxP family protein refolding chaperone